MTRFDDELARLARTDPAVVHRDLRAVHHAAPFAPPLRGSASRVLARVLDALSDYWQRCFAPYWPRMRALLEGDVARGQHIAQRGLAAMFAELSSTVRLVDNVMEVRLPPAKVDYARPTTDGPTLIPTLWTSKASTPISPDEPPMILSAALGVATLWQPQTLSAPRAMADLIGATRAGFPARLAAPASSTELAARLAAAIAAHGEGGSKDARGRDGGSAGRPRTWSCSEAPPG